MKTYENFFSNLIESNSLFILSTFSFCQILFLILLCRASRFRKIARLASACHSYGLIVETGKEICKCNVKLDLPDHETLLSAQLKYLEKDVNIYGY